MTSAMKLRLAQCSLVLVGSLLLGPALRAQTAANRMAIQGYVIDAEIDPAAQHLAATKYSDEAFVEKTRRAYEVLFQ